MAGAAVLTTGISAQAQHINTDAVRKEVMPNGVEGSLDAAVSGSTGNRKSHALSGSAHVQGAYDRNWSMAYANGSYAEVNDAVYASSYFAFLGYGYRLTPWVQIEGFNQEHANEFRRLRFRQVVGGGPRTNWMLLDDLEMVVAAHYMYEYDLIDVKAGADEPESETAHRWNNTLHFQWDVDEALAIVLTTYLQPRFDDVSDYRVYQFVDFHVKLSNWLTNRIQVYARYDSDAPEGVHARDMEVSNALSWTF